MSLNLVLIIVTLRGMQHSNSATQRYFIDVNVRQIYFTALTADGAYQSVLEMNHNFNLRVKTRKIPLWSLNRLMYFMKRVLVTFACDVVREHIVTKTCMIVRNVEILISKNAFLCDRIVDENFWADVVLNGNFRGAC